MYRKRRDKPHPPAEGIYGPLLRTCPIAASVQVFIYNKLSVNIESMGMIAIFVPGSGRIHPTNKMIL
jgi:hypothetical protein